MIQRIQSLYLLIAGFLMLILSGSVLFVGVFSENVTYNFTPQGLLNSENVMLFQTMPLFILYIILTAVSFLTILLFKNRPLQMRITIFTIAALVLSYILLYFYYYQIDQNYEIDKYIYRLPILFPLISAIVLYLAFRGIRKDELLIKSLNRLR